MSAQGLRIVPIYAASVNKRTADDVWKEMEQLGLQAWQDGKRIEAFDVCSEDFALLIRGRQLDDDGLLTISLVGNDDLTIIREAK